MVEPGPIWVHFAPLRTEGLTAAMTLAVGHALDSCSQRRPIVLVGPKPTTSLSVAAQRALIAIERGLSDTSTPGRVTDSATIRLRSGRRSGAGGPILRPPVAWAGSTLVLITPLGPEPNSGPAFRALTNVARAAGARGSIRRLANAGTWLARRIAAGFVVVAYGVDGVVAAALPRNPRAPAAFDAWVARRHGVAIAGPREPKVRLVGRAMGPKPVVFRRRMPAYHHRAERL